MSDECPVKPPKLLRAESTVETCSSCGAWVERYPSFLGESDGFWECEKCGCTSVNIRDGKPFAKKSRRWADIVEMFNDLYLDIPHWDWDTVVTDPPMRELDWSAIEAWFRSQNIYRVFLSFGNIEVIE